MGAKRFTDETYDVTGVLTPDVTGNYIRVAEYNSKPSYMLAAGGWFIWWDDVDTWNISTIQGAQGANYWTRANVAIAGVYAIGGGAIGEATVTLTV